MPYCRICGALLPDEKELRYCPNCGAYLEPVERYEKIGVTKVEVDKGIGFIPLKNRLAVLAIIFAICFFATLLGAIAKVSPAEAQDMINKMETLEETIEVAGVPLIFGNNLIYCLIMFVPVLGPISGLYVLYSTGLVLAAMSSSAGINPFLLLTMLFLYPHAWMEYLSYSLAISESFWLLYSIVRFGFGGFKKELTNLWKAIAICVVMLLLAAIIEMQMILIMS
jgi:uncharacterized membrane protein SpoIIM required for sporulation